MGSDGLAGVAALGRRIQIQTRPVLMLVRVEVHPAWSDLLRGRVELAAMPMPGAGTGA